ncbi:pyridoxal phosphate-dependent decarboxylase family protein [Acanthopleuribacter pedis]|uniref:Uncharacterized protein n=1 Tax=Acanthopleuribacter pedis TaxID=442870 RepID=A0A8J7QA82_9BACT|nr:hypothetical protein [Acanthopleuribacter pedis]
MSWLQDAHNQETIDNIMGRLATLLKKHYEQPEAAACVPPLDQARLKALFHQEHPPEQGMGFEAAMEHFENDIMANSIRTWHPLFLNQMFAGASFPAIVGDLLAGMLNPTLATFEASPAGTLIERSVATWMAEIIGMKPGSSGIFLPGGSLSNLMALTVARDTKLGPDIRQKGVGAQKVGILVSAGCHYSIANAAHLLGLGTDSVIKVATNDRNELLIEDFKDKLAMCDREGRRVFAAVATCGITVTGGFDPLQEMIEVCRDRDIHVHVDAAFGGAMAMTRFGKELFRGIEQADSVIWDAHKWLHSPLTCTVLLLPNPSLLKAVFASNASYLFHNPDHEPDATDDLGQYTLLCGKRFDALKVWLLFQIYGRNYFAELAEERWQFSLQIHQWLRNDADFEPCYDLRSPVMCFRYAPEALAGADAAYCDRLHRWCRQKTMERGLALFNMSKLEGRVVYRAILINPLSTQAKMEELFENLRELGEQFMRENPVSAG